MTLNITECPMCDSTSIRLEKGDYICADGWHIPGICYYHCQNCGENLYDRDASRAIDNALRAAGRLGKPRRMSVKPKAVKVKHPRVHAPKTQRAVPAVSRRQIRAGQNPA